MYIHNFGSPRIGNKKLAEYIQRTVKEIFRVVHYRDLVPHLPPEGEYQHPFREVFFTSDMSSYQVCNDSGEDKQCSNKFFPSYNPDDHDFYFEQVADAPC